MESVGTRADTFTFTTLGTMSGPVAKPTRSQPAHLLHSTQQAILIDVGDGAAQQLSKAGVPLAALDAIVISHLHIDHTGGLLAVLGTRIQVNYRNPLQVFGPVGTKKLVEGILESALAPLSDLIATDRQRRESDHVVPPLVVTEVTDGDRFDIGEVAVTVAQNNHFGFEDGSAANRAHQSLSFRFDTLNRSIAYTGDTGPCNAVTDLAQNVDLLVSEIIDPEQTLADLRPQLPHLTPDLEEALLWHFAHEHLVPRAVGELARDSGARHVVLVHNPLDAVTMRTARETIAEHYSGSITFADDLDSF